MATLERNVSLETITQLISDDVISVLGPTQRYVRHVTSITQAFDEFTITFCSKLGAKGYRLLQETKAGVVLCPSQFSIDRSQDSKKTIILVADPRLSFARLLKALFPDKSPSKIHSSAIVHPDAQISPNVSIGAYSVIGKAVIQENTFIYSGVHIYDNVQIGRNVVIHSGCVIGSDGFGFARTHEGELEKILHLGGVIIKDNVELQADCHVSRGTFGNTVIKCGSKFDSGCHVAHNVVIGENCAVAAHAMIAGSVTIGDRVWVGPCASISDGLIIGHDAQITIGSVVTRDVEPRQTVTGNFAVDHKKFLRFLRTIR